MNCLIKNGVVRFFRTELRQKRRQGHFIQSYIHSVHVGRRKRISGSHSNNFSRSSRTHRTSSNLLPRSNIIGDATSKVITYCHDSHASVSLNFDVNFNVKMETNGADEPPLQDEDLLASESASEADLRRDEELIGWIEEFVRSDEFRSRSIDRGNLDERSGPEGGTVQEPPPPALLLSEVQRRFRRAAARFEEKVRRGQAKKVIEGQDEAIERIRVSIHDLGVYSKILEYVGVF